MKQMLIRQRVDLCETVLSIGAALNPWKLYHQSFAGKPLYVAGLQLLAGFVLSTASVMAQEPAETPRLDNAMSWNLTGTTVVDKGQIDTMAEGKFAHDFVIESKATAANPAGSAVPAGTFKLDLSAFSPASDQHGQKKGIWYVRGKWTLTDSNAPVVGYGRHRPGAISGQIYAELAFNPVVTQKNWTAKVRLPVARIASVVQAGGSQLASGEGVLTMDSKRDGTMSLNLKLRPLVQSQETK